MRRGQGSVGGSEAGKGGKREGDTPPSLVMWWVIFPGERTPGFQLWAGGPQEDHEVALESGSSRQHSELPWEIGNTFQNGTWGGRV